MTGDPGVSWMVDGIGWLATALFASSYFYRQPLALRRVQGLAALLWMIYGAVIHAPPVVVANVIVAGAAISSSFRRSQATPGGTRSPRFPTPRFRQIRADHGPPTPGRRRGLLRRTLLIN